MTNKDNNDVVNDIHVTRKHHDKEYTYNLCTFYMYEYIFFVNIDNLFLYYFIFNVINIFLL